MPDMRPLKIILLSPDPERFRGVLTLAAAQAALGGKVAVFFQLEAAALLRQPLPAPNDREHVEKGLPPLAELMDDARALGVVFVACQSGMELCGMDAEALPPGAIVGGPVSFLQATDDGDRLVVV